MAKFSDYKASETAVDNGPYAFQMHRKGGQKQVSARFWGVVFYVLCFVFVEAIIKNELLYEDLFFQTEKERRVQE